MLDFTTEFGIRAQRRLNEDQIVWLTTVDTNGKPQPRPVWFYWDNESLLIYTRPQSFKVRHIELNSNVSLNFNSDHYGGDIVVLLGKARIEKSPLPPDLRQKFIEKYTQGLKDLNLTVAEFRSTYSLAIMITPTSLRGH